MTLFGTQFRLAKTSALVVGVALALALGACGSSSSDTTTVAVNDGTVPIDEPAGNEAPDQDAGSDGSADTVPSQDGLDSVPVLEPTLEIEIVDLVEPRRVALSPDSSLVAVLGGGPNTDFDPFLTIYDTTSGEPAGEASFEGDAGPFVDRIFWTADNRLVGIDTVSFESRVVTWDGATFDFMGVFVMDEFVCLDAIKGIDPVAGAIFAFDDFDGGSTLCRRELGSDTVLEVQPIGDHQLDVLMLRPDRSELVGEYYDRDSDKTMMARFDPNTLALLGETVLDTNELEGVGINVEVIRDIDGDFILQPSGEALPSGLKRPLFSPDGSLLWASSDDVEVLIDVATGQAIGQFELGRGLVTWSGDGSVLANPTFDNTVQIYRP
jgi:hypothetical protein